MKTKTIEDAAKELYPENRPTMFTQFVAGLERAAFKDGVEFAQRWISVEDELPEESDFVLVKTGNGCITTAYFHQEDNYFTAGIITHWRPIELK